MVNEGADQTPPAAKTWLRIPNGTKVKHRHDGYQGSIDGLTEIVQKGSRLNADGKTQYRINVGTPARKLAAEEDLLILSDGAGLMIMERQSVPYRQAVTKRFRSLLPEDRFVT